MKKVYIFPTVEMVSFASGDLAQIVIPVSGGTTPEESDGKFNDDWFDENLDLIEE